MHRRRAQPLRAGDVPVDRIVVLRGHIRSRPRLIGISSAGSRWPVHAGP
jgi:hypothetical protein